MDKSFIKIQPHFYLLVSLYLLALPFGTMKGMMIAAILHEFGHLLTSVFLGGKVRRIVIGAWGAQIQADYSEYWQCIFCLAAGPVISLLLFLMYPFYPQTAIWGLMQGILNLLPIYPLDGGRIRRMLKQTAAPPS